MLYFFYDRGQLRLHGYRLAPASARVYTPIVAAAGRLASEVLGPELVIEEGRLRFYQGTAQLLEPGELAERIGRLLGDLEVRADERARAAREEGVEQGHQEGRVEQARQALLHVLERRGLPLPAHLRARLEAERDLERLDRWLDAAIGATHLDEVFGGS